MPASESGRGGHSGRIGKQSQVPLTTSPSYHRLLFLPPTLQFHRFPLPYTSLRDLCLPPVVFACHLFPALSLLAPAALNTNTSFCHPSCLHNVSNARRPTECFSCHHSRISRLIGTLLSGSVDKSSLIRCRISTVTTFPPLDYAVTNEVFLQ